MNDPIGPCDVFLSHSSTDHAVAIDVVSHLEVRGVSCWMAPRDVPPGTTYAAALYYAIEAAPVFVVLMSTAANGSDHVARELEIANQMKKRIVPVRLEDFEATGAFCYYTRAMHFYPWARSPDVVVTRIAEQVAKARSDSTGRSTQ
jgi:hypothetical protein